MKTIRKALALLLALCMIFALAACSGGNDEQKESTPVQDNTPDDGNTPDEPTGSDLTANLVLATYPVGKMTDETEKTIWLL